MANQARNQPTFFDFATEVDLTKHSFSLEVTEALIELCHIGKDTYVLDAGCGTGKTSASFAKREGVLGHVEFKTADARQLTFDDATFDAIICESVLGFVPDKADALRELIRVCKPGGYVGLNETTWLTATVPPEIEESLEAAGFSGAKLITLDERRTILSAAGLQDLVVKSYHNTSRGDVLDRFRWFGITGILRNIVHIVAFARSSPANRAVLKHFMTLSRRMPKDFYDYYGYAIYVGRKP